MKKGFNQLIDPMNWSFRYYLIASIDECGFEEGWAPIIKKFELLCKTLLKFPLQISEKKIHLFYLQILAEFGDFRSFSDPLTPPSQEIKDKIIQMRRSQIRHELLITNNQMRFNNYILMHHQKEHKYDYSLKWYRLPDEMAVRESVPPNPFVQIFTLAENKKWYDVCKKASSIGKQDISIKTVAARCINGTVTNSLELLRDIIHIYANITLASVSINDKAAFLEMKMFFIEQLNSYLEKDPRWDRIKQFITLE